MSILKTQLGSSLGLKGETPATRAASLPSSQMHAQGKPGEEAAGFGRINNSFIASTPSEASNLNFKTSREYSSLDLDGETPAIRAAALPSSQMHAQGNIGKEAPRFGKINNEFIASNPAEASNLNFKSSGEYSNLDLDGKTPGIRSAALPSSQMHAQGNIGKEAAGFGRINNSFIASTPAEASNLKFKNSREYSSLDLDGETPAIRAAALPSSQMHAQGKLGAEAPGFGKINNDFIASTPAEASNLKFKNSREYSSLDLDGKTPGIRAGALNTSQMHAQGDIGKEAPGFGKINNRFIASTPAEASNLKFKNSREYSSLDLDGQTPQLRAGAQHTSQIHAQGRPGEEAAGFGRVDAGFIASSPKEASNLGYKKTREFSKLDFDGQTPEKYLDNKPG